MTKNLVAIAALKIDASPRKVWEAFVNPEIIKKYMFGTEVISDWKKGSSIVWTGQWKGKTYRDKGRILELIPERKLQYSHFSPLTGLEDKPENYHTVTVDLSGKGGGTEVTLYQDNCITEQEKLYSEQNWKMMLEALKKIVEK